VPLAYITLSSTGKQKSDEIGTEGVLKVVREWVDSKVANYKRLRGGVRILGEIPKTASGKVLRRLLPARLEMERGRSRL